LICQIEEIQSNIEKQNALLLIEKPVNDLLKLYKEKETLVEQRRNLNKAITNLSNTQVNLNTARVNYASLHLQFEKNMGSVCILCGQKITNVD
jgi:t-SNARE complex subunit (syntaxin)